MNSLRLFTKYITQNSLKRATIIQQSPRLTSTTVIDPPDDPMFIIPRPKTRENETLKIRKARLLYQSRKRGMLENDLLLSTFVAKHLDKFSAEQTELYDKYANYRLINGPSNDWEIYYWASEVKPVPDEYNNEIMEMLKVHTRNLSKEQRLRQPDLH